MWIFSLAPSRQVLRKRLPILAFLTLGREACAPPEPAPDVQRAGQGLDLTRQVFLAAILSGQRRAALNVVDEALRAGNNQVDIY
jgi:hypothetical protein